MSRSPRDPGSRRTVLGWFLAAVAASFAAGVAVGVVGAHFAERQGSALPDRNTAIVRYWADNYGLTREQVRQVKMVLIAKDAELESILNRNRSKLPDGAQAEIRRVLVVADERIRNVLNAEQFERYLQDSRLRPSAEADRNDSTKED